MTENTVAVINAGIGDISLAFTAAGYKVVAAYEDEEKSAELHKQNVDSPLLKIKDMDVKTFPEIDVLAAHIYAKAIFRGEQKHDPEIFLMDVIQEIIMRKRPRAFFFLIRKSLFKSPMFQAFLTDNYQYYNEWKELDVKELTGFPVKEKMSCVVGVERSQSGEFVFPEHEFVHYRSFDEFYEPDVDMDSLYLRVRPQDLENCVMEEGVFSWNQHQYRCAKDIIWDYRKMPIVHKKDTVRRISLREVALLKGFQENYILDVRNKSWMYQKLIYSGNVHVIRQIASEIGKMLDGSHWYSSSLDNMFQFEQLFGEYLKLKAKTSSLIIEKSLFFDYMCRQGQKIICFEVKYYSNDFGLASKVIKNCERIFAAKKEMSHIYILVVGNEISEDLKDECFNQYGIYIWDVSNLLWLFEEFPDIKSEFIALLNYAAEEIEYQKPSPVLFEEMPGSIKEPEKSWSERLLQISPGKEEFSKYEAFCVDILKYALGDYLTLWKVQKKSERGLYRFDLVCKIKVDVKHDFFETIKNYYNTKYIVFEFKNCNDKITQSEIYTTEKYLYEKALRKVAVIVSRKGAETNALQAVKGSLRESGKLILCLSDKDLLKMAEMKKSKVQEPAEILGDILDNLLLYLEK